MRRTALLLLTLVVTAGCALAQADRASGTLEQGATPLDRMLLGQAAKYPADETLRDQTDALQGSMVARRKMAWSIVEKVLAPVGVPAIPPADTTNDGTPAAAPIDGIWLPRFATWYAREDFLPMFDRLFRGLSDDEKRARAPFSDAALDAVFPWDAQMAPTLASFTRERYEARLRDLATAEGQHSLGGNARVLLSPGYVRHLLANYARVTSCHVPDPGAAPESATNDAPCLDAEFPTDAVAVKARWIPDSLPLPSYDTSAASITKYLANGTFGAGDGAKTPGEDAIYTMQLTATTKARLAALHIATKELRDWVWITLFWSPDPDTDFGADRPTRIRDLGGPWRNYKMCVVTGYAENDPSPGDAFRADAPTLADALDAANAAGTSTWCSNPYLEIGDHAARTNCIGCHQHGGTGASTESVLASAADGARAKVRSNFPVDYAYTTTTGLDLAGSMADTMSALVPNDEPPSAR